VRREPGYEEETVTRGRRHVFSRSFQGNSSHNVVRKRHCRGDVVLTVRRQRDPLERVHMSKDAIEFDHQQRNAFCIEPNTRE